MRLIDADKLSPDTEWDEYYDRFSSYSQLQIDSAPTVEIDMLRDHRHCQYCGQALNESDVFNCSHCGFIIRK